MRNAQVLVKANLPLVRPPIVKKNLEWPPHRNPADDGQAFARDGGTGVWAEFCYGIGSKQAHRNKDDTDDQADTTLLQKMFQGAARTFGFVGEVVVDRRFYHLARVAI